MSADTPELLSPRILVVDDERQIHSAVRLRLGRTCELTFCSNAVDALAQVRHNHFDVCLTDISMPKMDGLAFIEAAQAIDPCLGFVVLSAFDSYENLRRIIPLQVYDFVCKPIPDREGFEARIPGWVQITRQRRRDHTLAARGSIIASDLDAALLERDVEFIASESARDALLQTAGFLTTIHAHLVATCTLLAARVKTDSSLTHLFRSLDEARRTADAAMTSAESFFNSSYGCRDSSPAIVNEGLLHAIDIASRMTGAENAKKAVDVAHLADRREVRGLTGIEFLMALVPAIGAAIMAAPPETTIGIQCEFCPRLDTIYRNPGAGAYCWLNRKNALSSQPAIAIIIMAGATPLSRAEIDLWLKGEHAPLAPIATRGLLAGIRKSRGILGFSIAPGAKHFRLIIAFPT
jgi:CheY-like chemotaxis protein